MRSQLKEWEERRPKHDLLATLELHRKMSRVCRIFHKTLNADWPCPALRIYFGKGYARFAQGEDKVKD